MKIKFDRRDYLALEEIFEVGQLDDVTLELSEFSDDIEDMAYELAYTRYELAKAEARHNALVDAMAWERECDECGEWLHRAWWDRNELNLGEIEDLYDCARAEVDRLLEEK